MESLSVFASVLPDSLPLFSLRRSPLILICVSCLGARQKNKIK